VDAFLAALVGFVVGVTTAAAVLLAVHLNRKAGRQQAMREWQDAKETDRWERDKYATRDIH
jgi:hypothetical protein